MGADVNAVDSEGKTPLHEAILHGNSRIVEFLLKSGANVHFKTKNGECPLITAVLQEDRKIIGVLLKCGAHLGSNDFMPVADIMTTAIRTGSITKLESLKMAGATFDVKDELHQTPLHKAVLCNCQDAAEYLIKEGVRLDCKDILGHTPIDYAHKLNRRSMTSLMTFPADPPTRSS